MNTLLFLQLVIYKKYNKKGIHRTLEAFCKLGSDVGLGKGHVSVLLDKSKADVNGSCGECLTLPELLNIEPKQMAFAFGRCWRRKFEKGGELS